MHKFYIPRIVQVLALLLVGVLCGCSSPDVVSAPTVLIGATGTPFDDAVKAVYDGNLDYIKQCVDSDPMYVQAYDDRGRTLLHHAAESGNEDMVKYLLDKGALATVSDNDGYYPLEAAAQGANSKAVIDLLTEAAARQSSGQGAAQ